LERIIYVKIIQLDTMTDWDLLIPGIGLVCIGITGVGLALVGIAATFMEGMHAVSLLLMMIGLIFVTTGIFKDGFPTSPRAKSATFITLGFLVTFGTAAAVTVSTQVPSIFAYIGLMLIISIPAAVLTVASYRRVPYLRALAVIFIGSGIVAGSTYYAFGLVSPKAPGETSQNQTQTAKPPAPKLSMIINATILPGASAQGNPPFAPADFKVPKGAGIMWTNKDNVLHTVTSFSDNGKTFDSSAIKPGGTYLLDTSKLAEGTYEYFCTFHNFMKGKFTVVSANSSSSGSGNQSASSSGKPPVQVSIVSGASSLGDKAFSPNPVTASVGQTVTWKNDDTQAHTVTYGTGASDPAKGTVFDSSPNFNPLLTPSATYSHVFDKAGNFPYFCQLHPQMVGKVSVS
jgi:plastocyanin